MFGLKKKNDTPVTQDQSAPIGAPKMKNMNRKIKKKPKKVPFTDRSDKEIEKSVRKTILTISKALFIICLSCGILMAARSILNRAYLYSYSHGSFYEFPENLLQIMYFGENYVAPYNIGNADYQMGLYDRAVNHYLFALKQKPEGEKDCKVRINLALAICHMIDFDELDLEDNEALQEAIDMLSTARYYLTENGCACEHVDCAEGHSEDAEKLKHDIDEMLKKLLSQQEKNEQQQQQQNGGGGEDSSEQQNGGSTEEKEGGEESSEEGDADEKDGDEEGKSGKSDAEKEKQEKLKEALDDQKEALDKGAQSDGKGGYTYEYINTGNAEGYGEGTSW